MAIFTKLTKNEYRDLCDKAPFTTFFHAIDWHKFLEKQFKWIRFEYYLYKNEVILPLARFKIFGREKIVSLPFCEYGGPLPIGETVNLQEFEKDALKEFGDNIKIKFHPRILSYETNPRKDVRGLTSDISTHWIESFKNKSEQEIWSSFRKTLRHEIKHAQNQNLTVKRCESLKELKRFYNLYVANLKRRKTIPYPWPLIQFLYKNASSELLLAFRGDKIMGGGLFIEYSGFVHYFLSASDYRHRNLGANYLILWKKIKGLIGKDITLDLGATPKNSSLYTFKSGWGGKEHPIIVFENKKNSLEKLRSSGARNLFALLPNFVVKTLSGHLIRYRL